MEVEVTVYLSFIPPKIISPRIIDDAISVYPKMFIASHLYSPILVEISKSLKIAVLRAAC